MKYVVEFGVRGGAHTENFVLPARKLAEGLASKLVVVFTNDPTPRRRRGVGGVAEKLQQVDVAQRVALYRYQRAGWGPAWTSRRSAMAQACRAGTHG